MTEHVDGRACRGCGITHIAPGTTIDGEPLCWQDDDLCSACAERELAALQQDAARYRFLRNRLVGTVDVAVGGVFAGRIPQNVILGGEDLDRAIDAEMGLFPPESPTLESRLARSLAEAIDTPLMSGATDGDGARLTEIRLGFFNAQLVERACELLEEAGL